MEMNRIHHSPLHYWLTDGEEGGTLHIAGDGAMPDFDGAFEGGPPWHGFDRLVVHEGVTRLGAYAFFRSNVTEMRLPDSLRAIGKHCFEGCRALRRATWPAGVAEIRSSTFKDCVSLRQIDLPGELRVIRRWAFQNCAALEHVRIPAGIGHISATAFWGVNLDVLELDGSSFDMEEGCLYRGDALITAARGIGRIAVRPGTRVISGYAFYGNDDVEEVLLPDSVESIEEKAFARCGHLETIKTDRPLLHVGRNALQDCPADIVPKDRPRRPLSFSTGRLATTRNGYAALKNGRISCSRGAVKGDASPLMAFDDFVDIQGGFDFVLGLRRNGMVVSSVKSTRESELSAFSVTDIGDSAFPNHVRFPMPMRQIAAAESRIAGIDDKGMLFHCQARTFEQPDLEIPRIEAKCAAAGYDAVLYIDACDRLRFVGYRDWSAALDRLFLPALEKLGETPAQCKMYNPYYCTPTIAVLTMGKRVLWGDLPWGEPTVFPLEDVERFAVGSHVAAAVNRRGEAFFQFEGGAMTALPGPSRVVDVGLIHSNAAILLCEDGQVVAMTL